MANNNRAEKISLTKKAIRAEKVRAFIERYPQFVEDAKITPTKIIRQRYAISLSFYRILLEELHIERNEEYLKQLAKESKRIAMQTEGSKKARATCLERYGAKRAPVSTTTKEKISRAASDLKYRGGRKASDKNPDIESQLEIARTVVSNSNSQDIYRCLLHSGVDIDDAEQQFILDGCSFDIRIGKYLIEVNQSAAHSCKTIPKNYHLIRWRIAKNAGFEQLSLFDWTDRKAFIEFVLSKLAVNQISVGARKLFVKEVDRKEANKFLDANHVLHSCKGNAINLALVDKGDRILSLMTFGRPRFAKDYDFELLRFANLVGYNVQGAASKLFKYFMRQHSQAKVITYSDNNLGNGSVYEKLGFAEDGQTGPAVVWCNVNNQHIVKDVSLIMQGADRLLGCFLKDAYFPVGLNKEVFERKGGKVEYAKEYAEHKDDPTWWPGNQDIMLHYGYFPVADCGATRWIYVP